MIASVRDHILTTAQSVIKDVRIIEEAENFTPKNTDYPFIRFTFEPIQSILVDMSSVNDPQKQGIASFVLYNLRGRSNTADAIKLAQTIVDAFPVQMTELTDGSQLYIADGAWMEGVMPEEAAFGIPVFINWLNTGLNH